MKGVATAAMRGPVAAALMATLFAVLALFFVPLVVVSGAVVALVTLRHGAAAGFQVIAYSSAATAAAYLALVGFLLPLAAVMLVWVVVWLLAQTLRLTENQGLLVAATGLLVASYPLLTRVLAGDPRSLWKERVERFNKMLVELDQPPLQSAEIDILTSNLHEASVALVFVGIFGMVALARWWQALLFRPGAFAEEFQALLLPRTVMGVAALAAVATLAQIGNGSGRGFGSDALVIVVLMFALQGLAVVHQRGRAMQLSPWWLGGMYFFLLLRPQYVATLLAGAGIADSFADFRGLRGRRNQSN